MKRTKYRTENKIAERLTFILSVLVLTFIIAGMYLSVAFGILPRRAEAKNDMIATAIQVRSGIPLPGYLPDGYRLSEVVNSGRNMNIVFCDDTGHTIRLEYLGENSTVMVSAYDSDGMPLLKDVTFGEHHGLLYEDRACTFLVWAYDRHIYTLYSETISKEELLQIAESI